MIKRNSGIFRNTADGLQKGIFTASRVGTIVGAIILVLLGLLTLADVILRRFFNSPIPGSLELVEVGLGVMVFLSLSFCAVEKCHIVVDVLVMRFPQRVQAGTDAILYFCSAGIVGVLSWQLFLSAMRARDMNQISVALGIETYPFVLVAVLGSILLTLVFFIQFLYSLAEARRR